MKSDPHEMNDLVELPEYEDKVNTMFKDLLKLQEEMGDELSLKSIYEELIKA